MFNFAAVSTIALSLAASVSSMAVPRATPPSGWNTPLLESYDTYHTRYMALACNTKHGQAFFDQCCHPLLATQSLASRPAQCNPATSSTPAPPAVAPSSTPDDSDDDLPFCDDTDNDDDSSTAVVPATTKAAPAVTPQPAPVPTPAAPTPPKKAAPPPPPAPAPPAAKPATNSASSGVNTGGFATFFYQNGVAGACGTVHQDSDMIAAIDQDRYGNSGAKSSLCGQQVKITNTKNQKTVTVTIADDCPTCTNSNSIDLSSGAFQKLATLDEGMVPITWSFV